MARYGTATSRTSSIPPSRILTAVALLLGMRTLALLDIVHDVVVFRNMSVESTTPSSWSWTSVATLFEPQEQRDNRGGHGGVGQLMSLSDRRKLSEAEAASNGAEILRSTGKNQTLKELPVRNENGIIIYFFHIPTSGGSTCNVPFLKRWKKSMMVWGNSKHLQYSREIDHTLDNWQKGDTVFYEHFAGKTPSFLAVRTQLQSWRAKAKALNVPFFAFSMYREPLSFALSYFNYYHSNTDKGTRFEFFPHPTEEDFLKVTMKSPQCLFLARTEMSYRTKNKELRDDFTETECETAYQAFLEDMDWVGTTESMVDETFPLLQHVANESFPFPQRNNSEKRLTISDLSESAIEHVRNLTAWDEAVYERVQQVFTIDMFDNYDPPVSPKSTTM